MVGDLGIVAALGSKLAFDLSYRGIVSQRNQDHMASAALGLRF
ncbi:hypothetical protein [Sphingomonas psychrotolerans]|nr:hypothetical protein [Sphingomonas psychrotolerans]